MASDETNAILVVLERLANAYPERPLAPDTLAVYVEHLHDVPGWLLRRAAGQHICKSPWFPKVSDLRAAAAEIAGRSDFESLPRFPFDPLAAQAIALEEAFSQEGRLDPAEWRSLAAQFEKANRPHRAARTLERLEKRLGLERRMGGVVNSAAPP